MVCKENMAHILERLGVARAYQGFWYTVESCMLVWEEPERLHAVTKQVYYVVAERNKTSWNCVERDIRTVAKTVWKNGERELLLEFCGGELREQPTASEFIEMMCAYMRRLEAGDCYCPETGRWCEEKACLRRRIAELMGAEQECAQMAVEQEIALADQGSVE